MSTNDTTRRYGTITRLLHWSMAALFIWQFCKFFDRIQDGEHFLGNLTGPLHGSFGALILVLGILRILWAISQKQRPSQQGPLAALASMGHKLLYLLMLLMPLSGMMYVRGNGYPLKVFGTELMARTGVKTEWMLSIGELHSPLAWLTVITVLGHMFFALYHHIVLKDGTLSRIA
ncbi:MAG: cytochrome b [Ramlibacter sp.]|nr:cytochrome b [Ramlibacter sp.]